MSVDYDLAEYALYREALRLLRVARLRGEPMPMIFVADLFKVGHDKLAADLEASQREADAQFISPAN